MSQSLTVFENIHGQNYFLKTENQPYLTTGSEFSKNKETKFSSSSNTSTLKISRLSVQPSLRNLPDKKRGKE
jgi:hypothetical protein